MAGSLASLSIIRQRAACVDELRAGSSSLALIAGPMPLSARELLQQRINATAVRAHAVRVRDHPTPNPNPNPNPNP